MKTFKNNIKYILGIAGLSAVLSLSLNSCTKLDPK